ncbi:MAG TPA: crosslink repair DNA glycosylase YcaQ family protein [Blastocatellia bacterium]|nr:crosslink repair DNA glycosylase YcaQ family protein [Blastocatellia bacterium]
MLPPEIEEYRDHTWQRDPTLRIETAQQAEAFIERVGFCSTLTDSRRPGPSLYVAFCGRRDAVMPRNVQKDPEASGTWLLKDELVQRGRAWYGKLARGKAMFLAPRLIPHFFALWGVSKREEKRLLSKDAQAILKVLRKEWEMATADLREESGVRDRKRFSRAIDELQAAMIVIPSEVVYVPKFTYIWTLAEGRFAEHLVAKKTDNALREIARCFLRGAGMTVPGELAKVTGLSRPDAGKGNRALVAEGFAVSPSTGTYLLADLEARLQETGGY